MTTKEMKLNTAGLTKLRELTGAGMMDCKAALVEAKGDIKAAQDIIRKKGLDIAKKKSTREVREGQIVSYIHAGGKLGVLLEVDCETDFVAKNADFQAFCRDIAMQIAAAHPLFVSAENIPADVLEKEKSIFLDQVQGKPEAVQQKILEGKLAKRYEEICLLNQKFIKDDSKTVQNILTEIIARIGENIIIKRFVRFEVGGH
ncbi:MAG TPA: translation elongation factor Ts [Candidatus Omnitrophota bacterium]|nr:MAG: Elongation factor Ts [Candidatus Omnitrophica bacterium ADurb.Bin314]HPW65256.1 translation elongation factor Ts [Candidatus Omnitrophota bacterium]HQB94701.1 translation elongation factor Ts [Candidatus Omnitrophota bacterium]